MTQGVVVTQGPVEHCNPFVTSRNISKFLLLWSFPESKNHLKSCNSSDVWSQQWKNNCMVSTNFLTQKTIGKIFFLSNFSFQEMLLKRDIFINFLPQKFMTKYGIASTYSVTFVSQEILACLQWEVDSCCSLMCTYDISWSGHYHHQVIYNCC